MAYSDFYRLKPIKSYADTDAGYTGMDFLVAKYNIPHPFDRRRTAYRGIPTQQKVVILRTLVPLIPETRHHFLQGITVCDDPANLLTTDDPKPHQS